MKMGKEPDYRFSLANERTFLAWIRTALAFLATAVGLDILLQKHPIGATHHEQWLVIALAIVAIFTGGWAFLRWYQNEKAMRLDKAFCYSRSLSLLTCVLMLLGALVIGLVQ